VRGGGGVEEGEGEGRWRCRGGTERARRRGGRSVEIERVRVHRLGSVFFEELRGFLAKLTRRGARARSA
jgi:hypothetical protein